MLCATSDKEKVLISMQICDCLSRNNAFFPWIFRLKLVLSTWLCMEYKFRNNFSMNELSSTQKKHISSSVLRKTHLYIFSSLQPDCLIFYTPFITPASPFVPCVSLQGSVPCRKTALAQLCQLVSVPEKSDNGDIFLDE